MMRRVSLWIVVLRALSLKLLLPLLAIAAFSPTWLSAQTTPTPPKHIVIVIEENRSFSQIDHFIKDKPDSYLASLKKRGAYLIFFFALHHPSQPNYIVLFSGATQGIKDDKRPKKIVSPLKAHSLGGELRTKGLTFAGYAEGLPDSTFDGELEGNYVRKHCPWLNFADVPTTLSLPFTEFPKDPKDFDSLPTVSFVIPDLKNDMHGTRFQPITEVFDPDLLKDGDKWLREKLEDYAQWAMTNNSLLIVTWDEDNNIRCSLPFPKEEDCNTHPTENRIAAIFVGQKVPPGEVSGRYTHLDLLRTLEEMYGLPLLGATGGADVRAISDIWK